MKKLLKYAVLYPISVVVMFVQLFLRGIVSNSAVLVFLLSYFALSVLGLLFPVNVLVTSWWITFVIAVFWAYYLLEKYYTVASAKTNKIYFDYNLLLMDGSLEIIKNLKPLLLELKNLKNYIPERDFLVRGVVNLLSFIFTFMEVITSKPSLKINLVISLIAGFFIVKFLHQFAAGADWNMFYWPFLMQVAVWAIIYSVVRVVFNLFVYYPSFEEWKRFAPRFRKEVFSFLETFEEIFGPSKCDDKDLGTTIKKLRIVLESYVEKIDSSKSL